MFNKTLFKVSGKDTTTIYSSDLNLAIEFLRESRLELARKLSKRQEKAAKEKILKY